MSFFNKQMTRSILVAGAVVLAAMLLLYFGARAMGCRLNWITSTAGFVEPYLVLVQHGRSRGGGATNHCLKVMDVRSGEILLQRNIPSGLEDTQVMLADDVLVAGSSQQKEVVRFNVATREFTVVSVDDLRAAVPEAARVSVVPDDGVVRVTNLRGVETDLHPLTLEPGTASRVRPMEFLSTFSSMINGPLSFTTEAQSPLSGPEIELLELDPGLVQPAIIRQVGMGDDARLMTLSYETIERKQWIFSALTRQGTLAWQIRQADVAKEAGFPFEYARPQYHFLHDGSLIVIFEGWAVGFPGRILRVDVDTGTWEISPTY